MLKHLWQLILQARCPLCQRPARQTFCLDCQRQLQQCQTQSAPLIPETPDDLNILAWGHYGGELKRAIAALKYEDQRAIAQPLGQWIAQTWLQHPHHPQRVGVVPIPLHQNRLQQRGYNQAELLAEHFCRVTGLPLYAQGLKRHRNTQPQFGLSLSQRQQNLAHAFVLGSDRQRLPRHIPILLMDDIYTTGETARAAQQTLIQAGFKVWGVLTLARTYRLTETPATGTSSPNQHPAN
ncbi:ComF family protein [Synechococcales cyanobacterium C]|uniref:ComF family protein n=2 Tax=Petrachloros TaxID=2918834 RepID=A0A8K1ZY27_9CYAN|nr:ComF family protein [Petrachloros mirabilis ULC683]